MLAERNNVLKKATPLGTDAPYDLSTKGGSVPRSTANCYVISAPGHYRIPLVYGNAIENGVTNEHAYIPHLPRVYRGVLYRFKDHKNKIITDPWIEKTNNGANNGVNSAEVVWADADDLVHSPSIVHDGGEGFLDFTVSASDIQSGNAVVAVKRFSVTVWSWHLWFAPNDALDKIPITNHDNKVYNFTKEPLGWKPTLWSGSTYDKARTARVKVMQTIKNGGVAQETIINITQNPGDVKKNPTTTLYQFGRKDAFPGVKRYELSQDSHFIVQSGFMHFLQFQNPEIFFTYDAISSGLYDNCNLWSADNTVLDASGGNDNPVVKTIYDPCPVGFKMPPPNAFTGFSTTGKSSPKPSEINADGTGNWNTFSKNFGHNFWTNNSKTATIYFPASGHRTFDIGNMAYSGVFGYYWSALPVSWGSGCGMQFNWSNINLLRDIPRPSGCSVRPISE